MNATLVRRNYWSRTGIALSFALLVGVLIIPALAQEKTAGLLGPGGDPCLFGDINGDGVVDLLDLDPFLDLLFNNCEFQCEADIDQDGMVNLLDYCEFIQILQGG